MNNYTKIALFLFPVFLNLNCGNQIKPSIPVRTEFFGKMPDGTEITRYVIINEQGMEAHIINYGAIIMSIKVPDREGHFKDIVFGHHCLSSYFNKKSQYYGAIVGRYGNRIAKGQFSLDGNDYQLTINNGENHLHGGINGFYKVLWNAEIIPLKEGSGVKLTYVSKDGDQGYPGTLKTTVTYKLTHNNALSIEYQATTDQPTVINLTNHSFFNLNGAGTNDILDHELMINADYFTPVGPGLIPTGEIRKVDGTPMDFRKPMTIGDRINTNDKQLEFGLGYDHNWILNSWDGSLRLAAILHDPKSGRLMEVWTTEPGIQFYSGNFLDGSNFGKAGNVHSYRSGLCLETQHFPNSPNQLNFPTTVLRPGQLYTQSTQYRFSVK